MDSLKRIAPAAYVVAALLVLITLMDYLVNAWPLRPDDVDWRYDRIGLGSTYLLLPLLGCLIASITAAWFPHPRVSKLLGKFLWTGALLLLIASGTFVLDSILVRRIAGPETRWATPWSFVFTTAKLLAATAGLVVLARGNLRAAQAASESVGPRRREPARPVIGQS
ncbi:MAG TPA: hypothetical protein VFU23_10265 [Gemmatimonadales bacterium]|nr:hypothetical protein [Gemmatimonadales bacterium]